MAEQALELSKLVAISGNPRGAMQLFREYMGLSDPSMEIDMEGAMTKVNALMGDIEAGNMQFEFIPNKQQIKEARIRDFKHPKNK